MKTINQLKTLILCLSTAIVFGCSDNSDDTTPTPTDDRSFEMNSATDFFINRDGTVNIFVSGKAHGPSYVNFGTVTRRGFVFGTTSMTTVNQNNSVTATGPLEDLNGELRNLTKNAIYYVRGFFEMGDGSFFYGDEIQVSTDVDASNQRSIEMEMAPTPFWKSSTEMTPELKIKKLEKECPAEIGFEYSLNSDFSNSMTIAYTGVTGNFFTGVRYTEVVSNLTAGTEYHFRPYAKYGDGTVTNGGTSTMSASTSN